VAATRLLEKDERKKKKGKTKKGGKNVPSAKKFSQMPQKKRKEM